jgi:hypothetical protein
MKISFKITKRIEAEILKQMAALATKIKILKKAFLQNGSNVFRVTVTPR